MSNPKLNKINEEIVQTKERITEFQAKLRDLEMKKIELENMEILKKMRGIAPKFEDVLLLLKKIETNDILNEEDILK